VLSKPGFDPPGKYDAPGSVITASWTVQTHRASACNVSAVTLALCASGDVGAQDPFCAPANASWLKIDPRIPIADAKVRRIRAFKDTEL
jgi:hypothetical protein